MKPSPSMLLVINVSFMAIIIAASPLIALDNPALDGNAYETVLDGEHDILTFRNGSFESSLFAERGHKKGGSCLVIPREKRILTAA